MKKFPPISVRDFEQNDYKKVECFQMIKNFPPGVDPGTRRSTN